MLSLCIAAAMAAPPQTASELIGKMLTLYDGAQRLTGNIRMVQSVQNVSIAIDTTLQWEKPSKLFIRQDRKNSEPRSFFVTSDGKEFSYDLPEGRLGMLGERLFEQVAQPDRQLSYRDIYAIASRSLGDRSAPLDIAIARNEDLKYIRGQWSTVEFSDSKTPEGIKAVGGSWRLYATGPVCGSYEMWIEEATGALKKYMHRETILPDATVLDDKFKVKKVDLNVGPVTVTTVWDVDLKVDDKVDEKLFKVIK